MDIHIKLTIDDRFAAAARWLQQRLSRRLVSVLLGLCVSGAALAVLADPLDKAHTFNAGDPIRASELNANFDALYAELEARVVRGDMTLEVASCPDLQTALTSLDDRRIASGATFTIKVAEGESRCSGSLVIDHPDGGHIHIVGQGKDKTNLTFLNADGIVVPMSRALGLVDGLSITQLGGNGHGVVVHGAASARLGSDVRIRDFENGVYAVGGWVHAEGVISESNSGVGFYAYMGGHIWAAGALARGNELGFQATLASAIFAKGAQAEGNRLFGFDANLDGSILAEDAAASGGQHGFNTNNNGTLVAVNATAQSEFFGYASWNGSVLNVRNSAANGATAAGFSARMGSFAHVIAPGGDSVTYGVAGANTWYTPEASFLLQE